MLKTIKHLVLPVILLLILPQAAIKAQRLEDLLSKYTSENGKKYMQPFADAICADFNSGLFHQAKLKKLGVQIYFGLESQIAFIPEKQKVFTATSEGDWFPETTVNDAPTIFGPTKGKVVEDTESGFEYVFPGGFDLSYVPLAIPQITIGSVYGTDFTIRYIGTNKIEDLGKLQLFGWGVRHSVDQYYKLPINLTVAYYHSNMQIGEYLEANSNLFQLQSSFSIPVITLYGGVGYESGKVHMEYEYVDDYTDTTEEIQFDLKARNHMRLTLGVGFNLGPVNIHGDYNLARQSTFALGLGFGIGEK